MLEIIEKFEDLENVNDRYQIASKEYLASLRDLKGTRKSQLVTKRLILALAGSKGDLDDEYNIKGENTKYLAKESKFTCLEVLRNECIKN